MLFFKQQRLFALFPGVSFRTALLSDNYKILIFFYTPLVLWLMTTNYYCGIHIILHMLQTMQLQSLQFVQVIIARLLRYLQRLYEYNPSFSEEAISFNPGRRTSPMRTVYLYISKYSNSGNATLRDVLSIVRNWLTVISSLFRKYC